jgi:1,4-dihydroxy-6-naphthoate synthase
MKFSLGISPCPNDTFIFDALINKKIDTKGIEFETVLEDVQTLNEWAQSERLDFCKISYAALPLITGKYVALESGGALGKGVGPLLISKKDIPDAAVKSCVVAIPGQNTTANVLFSLAYPEAIHKVFLRYDEIENYVLSTDLNNEDLTTSKLGVIIHENRFTYESKGLYKIEDLGEHWEKETGLPIPLGCIIGKRSIDKKILETVQELIKESLEYSRTHYPVLSDFVKENAREMEESVMLQHIDLYVNNYSTELGMEGRKAVEKFIAVHSAINKIPVDINKLFLQ